MTRGGVELFALTLAVGVAVLMGVVGFMVRRAKRRVAEATHAEKSQTEQDRKRVKGDFLAMVGHEIRTPLNGIVGMTTLLGATSLETEQRKMLDQIGRSAEHMTRLVDDLLDYAFIEAGRMHVRMDTVDVAEIAEDVVDDLAPRARAKDIALDLHVDVDAPKLARADESRLRRVLRTLVENAIASTHEGSVLVRVQRSSDGERVRCAVADTGTGMTTARVDRLFTEAIALDEDTSRADPRLGARIAHALVERMGSELSVSSKLGAGTVFAFELAVAPSDSVVDTLPVRALIACEDSAGRSLLRDHSSRLGLRADVIERLAELPDRLAQAASVNDPYRIGFIEVDAAAAARVATAVLDRAAERLGIALPPFVSVSACGTQRVVTDTLDWSHESVFRPLGPRRLEAVTRRCMAEGEAAPGVRRRVRTRVGSECVLVAEDHETNRLVALGYVAHLGFKGRAVATGREAIDAVMAAPDEIDAILLDAEMPDGDGIEATRAIRAWEASSNREPVPIVIVTAHAAKFHEAEALAAGANAYVRKPIRIEEIGRLLYRLFGRKRERRISQPEPEDVARVEEVSVPVLDKAILDDLRVLCPPGDDSFLRDLIESFAKTTERLMREVSEALDAGDLETVRRHAHQMKGAARTLGATALGDAYFAMEAGEIEARRAAYARARVALPLAIAAFTRFVDAPSRSAG